MSKDIELTIKFILAESSVDYPDWVASLGEAIMEITGVDATIAAMQAADVFVNPTLARGMESFTLGWITLNEANWDKLTPNQIKTLRDVINGLIERINTKFSEEANKIPHIKELRR